jgi:hypothetical protein
LEASGLSISAEELTVFLAHMMVLRAAVANIKTVATFRTRSLWN